MATYEEDPFHPNYHDNTVGYHHDAESSYDPNSSDSQSITKKQRKELEEQKAADVGWRRIHVKMLTQNGRKVRRDVEYYSTGYSPNTRIRCPITGQRTNFRVGTCDEDLFYSVIMATGYNGQKTPDHLYYSTPDEYERHWNVKIGPEEKQRWYAKNLAERVRRT